MSKNCVRNTWITYVTAFSFDGIKFGLKNILSDIQKIIGIRQTKQVAENNLPKNQKAFWTLINDAAILTCLENGQR